MTSESKTKEQLISEISELRTCVLELEKTKAEGERTEKSLKDNEARYRNIFEHAIEGIFRTSVEGKLLTANPALAGMLGYDSPAEMIARITNVRKLYIEPGRRLEFVRLMREHGEVRNFEANVYRKDRSPIWVLINAYAMHDPDGKLVSFEGMALDITNRKRAEKNFENLIESLPDAILVVDRNFEVMLVNTRTEKLFGYNRSELIGRPYDTLIPVHLRDRHAEHCTGYFAKPTTKIMALHIGGAVALRRDGREMPVEINISGLETDEGIIAIASIRDRSR